MLLVVLVVLALIDVWEVVIGAGLRVTLAIVIVTALAVGVGHLLGGPEPATRTATAISSAARNPGLALLVATLNVASPAINATVLAYLVIAALTLIPYVAWRQRVCPRRPATAADRSQMGTECERRVEWCRRHARYGSPRSSIAAIRSDRTTASPKSANAAWSAGG